jgi:hypothetical protein
MSFHFRVVFTGLCAYVPNRPIDPVGLVKDKPTRVQVIMVDAREPRTAVDSSKLPPHFPIAYIEAENLAASNGVPSGTRLEWLLDRRELTFELADGKPTHFDLVQGALVAPTPLIPGKPTAPVPRAATDFGWGAHMEAHAPDFAQIDPLCFQDAGSKGLVATRVVLTQGRLTNFAFDPNSTFYFFDASLGGPGNKEDRPYSNKVALEVRDVTGVKLVARDLDGKRPTERLDLTGPAGDWTTITVANLCDGRTPERNPLTTQEPKDDDDFRWFYELCENRQNLAAALNGASLPIPRIAPGHGGPGAVQCMRATFAASRLVGG